MARCSRDWADVSHLTWWKLNSNHARVINRKEEGCGSKKVVVEVQWLFYGLLLWFFYNSSESASFNLYHSSLSTNFKTPISSYWKIFFSLSLHCCPVLDMPKPPEDDVFILPDEYRFIPRNKRAVLMKNQHSRKLNVEMLVVVDGKMMDNHGHENITTYVLTVLNMVRTDAETVALHFK